MTTAKETDALEIVPASLDDVRLVLSMLDEASDWLARKGLSQAQLGSFTEARIARGINAGEVYLAKLDGEVVGTMTLSFSSPVTWGDISNEAGYISRLTVRRSAAGKNIGRRMLEWGEDQCRTHGKAYARLDCGQDSERLLSYYDKAGYRRVGHANVGEWTACLFEKVL